MDESRHFLGTRGRSRTCCDCRILSIYTYSSIVIALSSEQAALLDFGREDSDGLSQFCIEAGLHGLTTFESRLKTPPSWLYEDALRCSGKEVPVPCSRDGIPPAEVTVGRQWRLFRPPLLKHAQTEDSAHKETLCARRTCKRS